MPDMGASGQRECGWQWKLPLVLVAPAGVVLG